MISWSSKYTPYDAGNGQQITVHPKPAEDIGILLKKAGVSTHIILTLIWILFLSMSLTVLITAIFWQRDIVHGFADREKIRLQHQVEDNRISPENILKNKDTTAIGGIFFSPSGEVTVLGMVNKHDYFLRGQAEKALYENNTLYSLEGFFWNIFIPGKAYLIISMPVNRNGKNQGAIAMLYPLSHVYRQMETSFKIIFPCLLVNMLILLSIALFRFRRFLFLPLANLIRLADTYYHEDGTALFLTLARNNELGQLSSSLQKMLQRIEDDRKKLRRSVASLEKANRELLTARTEMIRTEKLASVGRLAAGLAHEIGNPIGVILGYIGLLKDDKISARERANFTSRAEREIQRINRLIRQLLDFSRLDNNLQIEQVSVHAIIYNLMEMMTTCQPIVNKVNNQMELKAEYDIVKGDPDQLQQVFFNCLLNAADALVPTTGEQTIKIKTTTVTSADKDKNNKANEIIRITINDSGEGIKPEDISRIFDPFFTTKEPGKGTGLGLSVALSIIEHHGGILEAESSVNKGTTIIIELPLCREPDARSRQTQNPEKPCKTIKNSC